MGTETLDAVDVNPDCGRMLRYPLAVPKSATDLGFAKGATATRYLLVSAVNFIGHQTFLFLANSVW